MTPKEKAIELSNKFVTKSVFDMTDLELKIERENAKRNALIAVNEIIKQCWDYRDIDLQRSYDYWQEVKKEIQAL
jgi:hypothetical protein